MNIQTKIQKNRRIKWEDLSVEQIDKATQTYPELSAIKGTGGILSSISVFAVGFWLENLTTILIATMILVYGIIMWRKTMRARERYANNFFTIK